MDESPDNRKVTTGERGKTYFAVKEADLLRRDPAVRSFGGWHIEFECKSKADRLALALLESMMNYDIELAEKALGIAYKQIQGPLLCSRLNKEQAEATARELEGLSEKQRHVEALNKLRARKRK